MNCKRKYIARLGAVMAFIYAVTFTNVGIAADESGNRTWCIPEFSYADIGGGQIEITGMGDTDSKKIIIPQTIDGKTVTKIKNVYTNKCHTINTVVLPDTVTEIADSAFRNYMSAATVVFPVNLKRVGSNAFISSNASYNALSLTDKLPMSISELGDRAFYATNLKNVEFGSRLKNIAKESFLNCYRLKKIKINDGVDFISEKAFANTKALSEVIILDNDVSIANDAFDISEKDMTGTAFDSRENEVVFKALKGSSTEKYVNEKIRLGENYKFEPIDYSYRLIDDDTIAITGTSLTGEITVPQKIDNYKVSLIDDGAIGKSVTKVSVYEDIKVSENALANAGTKLEVSELPKTDLTIEIGQTAANTSTDKIFGIGHPLLSEYSNGRLLLDINGNENTSFYEISVGDTFPLIRLGAMEANLFDWKTSIGKYKDRPITMISRDGYYDKIHTGLDDIVNGFTKVDKNAAFSYTVNLWSGYRDIANMAEYLVGDGKFNINGGENWAERRKANGVEDPVNIVVWELGNEVDLKVSGKSDDASPYDACRLNLLSADEYAEKCLNAIKAILSVDDKAVFAVHDVTSYENGGKNENGAEHKWRATVFEKLKPYMTHIKYLSMHRYYNNAEASNNISTIVDRHITNTIEDLDRILGEGHGIKIYFSEQSFHYVAGSNLNNGAQDIYDMETVLNLSDFYNRVLPRSEVGAASFFSSAFSLSDKWQWAAYYDISGETKPSAAIDLMRLYKKYGIGSVLPVTLKNNSESYFDIGLKSQISAAAVKTADGVNVFLTNLSDTDSYNVYFPETQSYSLVREHVLTGKTLKSANYKNKNGIRLSENEYGQKRQLVKYCVPKASVVVLELKENGSDVFLPSFEALTKDNKDIRFMSDISDENTLVIKLKAGDYNGKNREMQLFFAKYLNGRLTSVEPVTVNTDKIKKGYVGEFDISERQMFDSIKIFVWDKESIVPFCEHYEIK